MSRFTVDQIPNQAGRLAVVTGANSGIGYETALGLAKRGAHVILACRSAEKGDAAVDRIRAAGLPAGAVVELRLLDLSDLESVARFAEALTRDHARLDLLINNAGVMVPPFGRTQQGFETQFGTNHLGHFALTQRLLPTLLGTPGSRVVVVSSSAHHFGRIGLSDLHFERRRYNAWVAYGQSKLANLMFARELDRRLRAAGASTIATAAHPGWTATDLQRESTIATFFNPHLAMIPADGALPTLQAATDPAVEGGAYIGPDGLFELRGAPAPARINRRAKDEAMAAQLWEASEALVGLRFDLPVPARASAA